MKQIVIVALALSMWVVPIPQDRRQPSAGTTKKERGADAQLAEDARDKQQAAEIAALNAMLAALAKSEQESANERQQEAAIESENVHLQRWMIGVGLAQTFALIGTLVFIGWQAKETARAAKATETAAKAAKTSADAFLSSERAWLIPAAESVKPNGLPTRTLVNSQVETVTVRIENCGRTPAWIMDWFIEAIVLDDTNIGQFTNAGRPEGDFPNARPFPQGRTEDFSVEWTTNQSEIAGVKAGQKHLYIYGFLQYRSIVGDDPCVSRFCFHYFYKRNTFGRLEEGWAAEPPEENHYT
jgi:hypothetical protein